MLTYYCLEAIKFLIYYSWFLEMNFIVLQDYYITYIVFLYAFSFTCIYEWIIVFLVLVSFITRTSLNFILQVHFIVYLVLLCTQVSRACLLLAFSS